MAKAYGKHNNTRYYLPVVFALVLCMGVLIGLQFNTGGHSGAAGKSKLSDVINFIETKYVDTIDHDKLSDGVLEKMLSNLDPHSFYIPPKDITGVNESLEGEFQGIGVEFFIVKDTIQVVSPISGGPSEALGIRAGDKIVTIEDTTVAGIGIKNEDVIGKLRGKKGTKVKVGIKRQGAAELIDYEITRDDIPIYSLDVGYMVDDQVGYIKLNRFSATTYTEFKKKLYELQQVGMQSLVLDLRQNPGGYLDAAIKIADEFLDGKKMIVYTEGRAYAKKEYFSSRPGFFEEGKLIVLIDQGSASASEIIAGAVQDWDRGSIIGRRSFGKGLVQEQYQLSDGSAMRLTVARYFTPAGRCIQKPYAEGTDAYHGELIERYESGELTNADSVKQVDSLSFTTAGGRTVYGGGGITPDIFVPLDTVEDWAYLARLRQHVPEFTYDYYSKNTTQFEAYEDFNSFNKGFKIDAAMKHAFLAYAAQKGITMKVEANAALEAEIRTYLKAYFARQRWNSDGFYPVMNELDNVFQRAMMEIKQ